MSTRILLNAGGKLVSTQGLVQACAFLRNVIIARLITPADFGIAATFAMTVVLLDMISNLDANTLLIQAEYGDEPRFQRVTQLMQASRGFLNALVLFLAAAPLSYLFGVPDAAWAFRWVALVPLIRGLAHADPYRQQRQLLFRPIILIDVTTSLLLTIIAVLLGLWLRDYSLMLWVLLTQACLSSIASHLVASRPYRWAFDRQYLRRIVAFGWPLLVNGVLLFVIFQGDRFVIGSASTLFSGQTYTLSDLGVYSVAFALTMAPATVVATVGSSLFLPLLSRVQNSRHDFDRRYLACAQVVCLSAALIAIPIIVGGQRIVLLVYGQTYADAGSFIGWIAAMWALRTMRVAPTLAAMAKGDTRNAMLANIVRAGALVGVLFSAASGLSLIWVAASGFCGELLAAGITVGRLSRQHGVPSSLWMKPAAVALIGIGLAAVTRVSGITGYHWLLTVAMAVVPSVTVSVLMLWLFPTFRRDLQALIRPEALASVAR